MASAHLTVGGGVALLWAALGLVRQHTMQTGIDLGLYTQAVAGYAHGHLPWAALKTADGRFDLLGDHFTPVMALLAPAYRIWPHPSTLIVAQAVLVGIGVGVLARTAGPVFGTAAAGVAVGLALGVSWGIAGLTLFDVHEVAFAVPLLAVVVDRAVADRWGAAVGWAFPLLLVKEDGAFLLAGLGLACWAVGRRKLGTATCAAAVTGWWLTTGIVIPALSWSGRYTYWSTLGAGGINPAATAGRVILAATSTPGLTLLTMLLAGSLGLAMRSPLAWMAVPPLLARFATAHAGYWGPGHQYDASLVVVLAGAAIDAVHRGWWRQWHPRVTHALPIIMLAVSVTLAWWSPLQGATKASFYTCARCDDARAALALVPDGADVAADTYLVDQLVDRTTVRLLAPGLRDSVGKKLSPEWIAADRRSAAWPGGRAAVDVVLVQAAARGCVSVYDADDYVVLRC